MHTCYMKTSIENVGESSLVFERKDKQKMKEKMV